MTTLVLTDPVNGTVADANTIASNNTAVKAVVNGNIDNANVASAANIAGSKLLDGSVTDAKLVQSSGTLANMPPGRELLYTQFTSPVSITSTSSAAADVIVTASAFTFDGATVALIEFYSPAVQAPNSSAPHMYISLYEDGTHKGVLGDVTNSTATTYSFPMLGIARFVPASGSRTYSVRGYMSAGSTTQQVGAGAFGSGSGTLSPGFIRVVKAT